MALGLVGIAAAAVPEKSGSVLSAPDKNALPADVTPSADVVVETATNAAASELQQQMAALVKSMRAEALSEQSLATAAAIEGEGAAQLAIEPAVLAADVTGAAVTAAEIAEPVLLAQAVVPAVAATQAAAAAEVSAAAAATTAGATTAAASAGAVAAASAIPTAFLIGAAGLALAVGASSSSASAPPTPLDTAPPVGPTLSLASDTGALGTDAITSSGVVNVTGLEADATWQYSTNAGSTWSAGTGSSFTLSGDGAKSVTVRQTDAAGNVGAASTALVFTLDKTIATPTVALTTDTGINTDQITSDAALSLSTAASDVTRSFTVDGGAASANYTAPTADGSHTVVVTDTDTAGNTASASLTLTLDKTIATPTVALTSDTGTNTTDKLTSNAALSLSEKAADVTRSFSVDGGAASANYTAPTADGAHTVLVTDTDTAGNTASASLTFTLDTTAPEITGMTAKKDTSTIDLTFDGPLDGDNLPINRFEVTQGGSTLAIDSVALTPDGNGIRVTLNAPLAPGFVKVKYTDPTVGDDSRAVQDAAGNDSLGFISGTVADGYVRGASVYIDTNGDGTLQTGQGGDYFVGTTDAFGNFFIPASAPPGSIIAVGGVNIDTGVANTVALKAPEGSSTINPLTTMVQAVVEQQVASGGALTAELINAAASSVAQSLGLTDLPAGASLTSYDPISSGNVQLQKAAAQVATMVALASSGNADNAGTVVANLAAQLQSASNTGSVLDLADASTVSKALVGVTVSDSVQSSIADASSAIGNATSLAAISTAQSQALDTTKPLAPSATGADITNNTTPTTVRVAFNTTLTDGSAAVAGDVISITEGGLSLGVATLTASDIAAGFKNVDLSTALSEGSHSLVVTLTDQGGNASAPSSPLPITVDTTAPTTPGLALVTDSGSSATDSTTSSGVVNVIGLEGGASWQFSTDSGVNWTNGIGNSFTLNGDGDKSVIVRQADAAGNISASSSALSLTLDSTAPSVRASITGAADNVEPTIDNVAAGGSTNDQTLDLSGTLSAELATGEKVVIYDGLTALGSAAVTGANWTFTTTTLSNTSHSLSARVEDAAGNRGAASAGYGVTVNAAVPTATATVASITDAFGTVTGPVSSGGVTNDAAPVIAGTITGTLETGAKVVVYDNGLRLGDAVVSGSNWSLSASSLVQGTHSFRAVVENLGGNQGTPSAARSVVVDASGPVAPTINPIGGNDVVNSAEREASVTLSGTTEAGSSVTVIGNAATVVGTTWTYNLSKDAISVLQQGSNSVTVVSTDAAGNTGAIATRAFTLDTNGPITTLVSTSGTAINAAELAAGANLTGTTEAGARVSLTLGDGNVRSVIADGSGAWSYTLVKADVTAIGQDAAKTLSASATDTNGNTGASATTTVTVDTKAPVLTAFALADASDSGLKGDGRSNVLTPSITFTAELGATLALSTGGDFNDASTGTNLPQTLSLPQALASDGIYTLTLRATDAAGNVSLRTGTYTLDTQAPGKPTIAVVQDDVGSIKGGLATAGVTDDTQLLISGNAEAFSLVTVFNGSASLGKAYADKDGAWSLTTSALTNGTTYNVVAEAADAAGNVSVPSDARSFTIDTTPPVAPGLGLASDSGGNSTDTITASGLVNVTGIEPGANWQYSTDAGANWATGTGSNFTLSGDGAKSVMVRQSDVAGNAGPTSTPLLFALDTAAAAPTATLASDTGGSNSDKITSSGLVNVTGLEPGATWEYSTNNGVNWTAGTDSSFALSGDGAKAVQIRQTDLAGNTSPAGTLGFTLDTQAPATGTITAIAVDGGVTGDRLTNDNTPVISVTAEPGAKVGLGSGGNSVDPAKYTVTENSPGQFIITVTQALADGGYGVIARDAAGNAITTFAQDGSDLATFRIDTSAPTAAALALVSDSGSSSNDGITNIGTVNVSGLEAGATWQYSTNGGGSWADGSGSDFTLSAGSYAAGAVQVRQTDQAGNLQSATPANIASALTIDQAGPTATIQVSKSNLKAGDTAQVTLTFNEKITGLDSSDLIVQGGTLSTPSSADDGKTWTATLTPGTGLESASNTITLSNTGIADLAGNAGSGNTASGNFAVDTKAPVLMPVSPADNGLSLGLAADLVLGANESLAKGTGTVSLFKADGLLVESLDVGSSRVAIIGSGAQTQVRIDPSADLIKDEGYYVTVSSGAFLDTAGNPAAGITNATAWNFTGAGATVTVNAVSVDNRINLSESGQPINVSGTVSAEALILAAFTTQDLLVLLRPTAGADITLSDASYSYTEGNLANWSATLPASQVSGTGDYTLVVTMTGKNGDAANVSGTGTQFVQVDTVVAPPTASLAVDSGASTPDGITNNGTVNVTGLESGATWQYSTNGGSSWTAGSGTSVNLSGDEAKSVTVRQTDAAGNVSNASTALAFTLDKTIATPTVTLTTDTGTNTTDKLTSNAALALSTAASDVSRSFTVDSGAASANYTAPTTDGSHTVVVTDTDTAGNTASAILTFTLDKTIATPMVALTTDAGASNTDKLTNNAALSLSTAAADVTRSVTVDGGAASANYVAPTSEGSHTVVVTDTDTAGNTASASLTFTLDTTAPAKATITAIDADGGATGDRLTNDNTPVISLTATAGSKIFLGSNGTPVDAAKYSAVETSAGNYAVTVNQPLADGGYGLVVMDAAGNANTTFAQDGTDLATFRIDASAPLAIATITGATDNVPSTPTSNIAAGGTTNDNTPTLQGTLTAALGAGEVVAVYDGANRLGTASVAGSAWQFTTAGLTNGNHSFSTRVEDAAGNIGQSASPYAIDVQTLSLDAANKVLFVGNSATFGRADPVLSYNTYDAVTNPTGVKDLTAPIAGTSFANLTGSNLYEPHPWGGVAGLFDAFAQQLGIDYDVSMSTRNAATLLGHYSNTSPAGSTEKWDLRGNIASQKWEMVVLQDQTDEPLPSGTGSITFAAGSSVATLVVTPNADTVKEYDEALSLKLAAASSYRVGTSTAISTSVLNDDPTGPVIDANLATVQLVASPGSVTEDGSSNLVFTFTRTGSTASDLTVNFTAVRDGSTSPSVSTTITSSQDLEMYNTTTGALATAGGTGTSPYRFTSGVTGFPGSSNTGVASTTGAVSFTSNTGSIVIKAGQTSASLTLDPRVDSAVEPDESIRLTLVHPTTGTDYNLGTLGSVVGTIVNDDFAAGVDVSLPNVTLALGSTASVYESSGQGLVYTFTRSGDTTSQLTVNFDVTGTATYFASDATKSDFAVSTSGVSGYTLKTTGGANADIGAFQKYANLIEDYIHTGAADSTTISGTTIAANPNADANTDVYLYQTWARPDMVVGNFDMLTNKVLDTVSGGYTDGTITKSDTQGAGYYLRLEDMSADLAAAYNGLAAANPDFDGAAPVATAFMNAVLNGTAIRDPYTETAGNGKVNLWFDDNLHASKHGSYLASLTLFGTMTGIDPRALGGSDKVASDLGIDSATALALQTVASATLGLNQSYIWSKPGTVTELGDGASATLATAGGFGFADSASAVHTVSVVPGQGALGTLTASIRSDGSTGQVNWLYTVNNQTIDPLLAFGQQSSETFTLLVSSGNGGTVSKTVTVNLLGTSTLQGTAGADSLIGSVGNDTILGLAGDDSLNGGLGNDVINGGDGNDWAMFTTSPSALNVNLTINLATGGAGNDTLISIENVSGTGFGDSITGDGAANRLAGNDGNDGFVGNGGNDTISGGVGSDSAGYLVANTGSTALSYAWDFTAKAVVVKQGTTVLAKITAGAIAGDWSVQDLGNATATGFGTDTLTSIESLSFDFGTSSTTTSALTITSAQLEAAVPSDTVAPTLTLASPDDNSTAVAVGSNIVLTFSEPITAGTGNIVISNGSDTRTISIADASQVSINGAQLTLNPTAELLSGSNYNVQIDAGVVKDVVGNAFAGITDATTLNFATALQSTVTKIDWTSDQNGSGVVQGESLYIQAHFTNPVLVTGSPQLSLQIINDAGVSHTVLATFEQYTGVLAGSTQNSMQFKYTLAVGDTGHYHLGDISLNGGTITESSAVGGLAADLTLNSGNKTITAGTYLFGAPVLGTTGTAANDALLPYESNPTTAPTNGLFTGVDGGAGEFDALVVPVLLPASVTTAAVANTYTLKYSSSASTVTAYAADGTVAATVSVPTTFPTNVEVMAFHAVFKDASNNYQGTTASDVVLSKNLVTVNDAVAPNEHYVQGSIGTDTINLASDTNADARYLVRGGPGADTITGSSGRDSIKGDGGNNLINAGAGNDAIFVGSGNDTVDGGLGSDKVVVTLDGQVLDISGRINGFALQSLTGTWGANGFTTTATANVYRVLTDDNGELTVKNFSNGTTAMTATNVESIEVRLEQSDVRTAIPLIFGDANANSLTGTGTSIVNGEAGNDTLTASNNGKDVLFGGSGNDTLIGGSARDLMYGGSGDDSMTGNAGNDWFVGNEGNDIISGGDGTDGAAYALANTVTTALGYAWDATANAVLVNQGATALAKITAGATAGSWTVQDLANGTATGFGTDTLTSIESLSFDFGTSSTTTSVLTITSAQLAAAVPVDTVAPTLAISPPNIITNGVGVFNFTFSEAVTGFDATDIVVIGGTPGTFAGSGASYTMQIAPTPSTTPVVFSINVAGSAGSDLAGNASIVAAPLTASLLFGTPSADVLTVNGDKNIVYLGAGNDTVKLTTAAGSTMAATDEVMDFSAGDKIDVSALLGALTGGAGYAHTALTDTGAGFIELVNVSLSKDVANNWTLVNFDVKIDLNSIGGSKIDGINLDLDYDASKVIYSALVSPQYSVGPSKKDVWTPLDGNYLSTDQQSGTPTGKILMPANTAGINPITVDASGKVLNVSLYVNGLVDTFGVAIQSKASGGITDVHTADLVTHDVDVGAAKVAGATVGSIGTLEIVTDTSTLVTPGDNQLHFLTTFANGMTRLQMQYDTDPVFGTGHTAASSIIAMDFDGDVRALLVPANMNFI